jgi:thioredoxin reductase (NADPH)
MAGLSAATYLGRAMRNTLLIDSGKSMARWEPDVQNYLGFPDGVGGTELLERGRAQAKRYGIKFARDKVNSALKRGDIFYLKGEKQTYTCRRLLVCTGIFHIPPEIPEITPCLGHSMFFCKDCDGYRVQGKAVAVYGWRNETVRYALGMLHYSACVAIVTDGKRPKWDAQHAAWIKEYNIPVYQRTIIGVHRGDKNLRALRLAGGAEVEVDALFTTRGDIYFNKLAKGLGAKVDPEGQIVVDVDMRTTVPGLYAAGCVTPANCQMIIAAGQGATAAQAINRDMFEENLRTHSLRRFREEQLRKKKTRPRLRIKKAASIPELVPA